MKFRTLAAARGDSAEQISDAVTGAKFPAAILLIGARGTGKTQCITSLTNIAVSENIGRVPSTGYTGVAAALYLTPTLLKLLSIKVKPQKDFRDLRTATATELIARRTKFRDEIGYDIDQVGGLVVDEVSFIDVVLLGHVDYNLRALTENWGLQFVGIPIILAGDNLQKPPVAGQPWYKTLVEDALTPQLESRSLTSAALCGLRVLKSAQRHTLTRIMRSILDPAFTQAQLRLRDTTKSNPVTRQFLETIKPLTAADLDADFAWRFAPIGVLSRLERDVLNLAKLTNFAKHFDLPLVRWRRPIKHQEVLEDLGIDLDEPYEAEDGLWEYFVAGAPGLLTDNIKSARGLVNGTPFLYDSLDYGPEGPPPSVAAQLRRRGFAIIDRHDPPPAIVVRVGSQSSSDPNQAPKHLWHGVPLADLNSVLIPFTNNDNDDDTPQLVPLFASSRVVGVPLRSTFAAQHGLTDELDVTVHPVMPAFALTDYKVQGRTMPKLIINLPQPLTPKNAVTLNSFYVFISRGKVADSLRWLERNNKALDRLTTLQHDPFYTAWNEDYNDNGYWNVNHFIAAYPKAINERRNLRATRRRSS